MSSQIPTTNGADSDQPKSDLHRWIHDFYVYITTINKNMQNSEITNSSITGTEIKYNADRGR